MTSERLIAGALSIASVRDGATYVLPPDLLQQQTNLFFTVARVDNLFIKVPTERGMADYRAFIRDGEVTDADVRALEDNERFDRLDDALRTFPELASIALIDPEHAHYLAVHRMQYDRLRAPGLVGIPESRFALIGAAPGIFQQRIPGATLWEMFDFDALRIRQAWQPFRVTIAAQLRALLNSPLANHVDWNIKNFVFHGAEQRLYYVDSKPTLVVARSSNELNLTGIHTHFLA